VTLLAIDTCEACCSVALLGADGQSYVISEKIGRGHAERLLPMIGELLTEAGLAYADLTRIAVTTGPGTFTGLRIGLSVARGLALSLAVPCIGVPALMVLGAQAKGCGVPVHTAIKGRGGQIFYQAFDNSVEDDVPFALCEAVNIDAVDAEGLFSAAPGALTGSGACLIDGREETLDDAVNPVILAQLAQKLRPEDFAPEPLYLRAADAVKAKTILNIAAD